MNATGASEVIRAFKTHLIKDVFVFPGGTIAPILDLLEDEGINIFCSRHEQGAGYATIAASKIREIPQVTLVSSGPGVTNVITPIADAFFDSIPLVVCTGQVGTKDMKGSTPVRQRGFQEVDTVNVFAPITKAQFQPKDPSEVYQMICNAFEIASSGRPGPVLVDLPMDVQRSKVKKKIKKIKKNIPNKIKTNTKQKREILKVADILNNSDRPLILSGHGVILDRAENILRKLAINYNIPVTMSLLGLGAFPTQHQLSLGFHGHTGSQVAGLAIQNCDVLLVVGSRLDIRQIGTVSNKFAPKAKIIRIEIDKEELKACRVSADFVLMGRSKTILHSLFDSLNKNKKYERQKWLDQIIKWKNQHKNYFSKGKKLKPQSVIEELNIQTEKEEVICVSGVGLHQQWTARHFDFDFPKRRWFTSGGHGAMGYDLPVAMGSQYCEQNKLVLCVVGDGSLQMNIQELATLIAYSLPVKLIVIDNHSLGIVSQFQNLNWNRDPTCGDKWNPDFAKIAKSYGMLSETVKKNEELSGAIKRILKSNGPALLHCIVDEAEEISPMLLAGQTLDQMWKK